MYLINEKFSTYSSEVVVEKPVYERIPKTIT